MARHNLNIQLLFDACCADWSQPVTVNSRVAAEPFDSLHPIIVGGPQGKSEGRSMERFQEANFKHNLVALAVVFPSGDCLFKPGMRIWVREDCKTLPWARQESFVYRSRRFILVPYDAVQMVDVTPASVGAGQEAGPLPTGEPTPSSAAR